MSIEELDTTVRAFYEGRGEAQKRAELTLNQFKENPDAWLMVDKILQSAQYPQTKCEKPHTPCLWDKPRLHACEVVDQPFFILMKL